MIRTKTATPAGIDIKHWISRAEAIREEDGGYVHESLAVEMARTLGWWRAARIADGVGVAADTNLAEDEPTALADCLGWAQSVLFAGWFRHLENYRMIRDDFPGDLTNHQLWASK